MIRSRGAARRRQPLDLARGERPVGLDDRPVEVDGACRRSYSSKPRSAASMNSRSTTVPGAASSASSSSRFSAGEQRQVAAEPDLHELVGELRYPWPTTPRSLLRVLEPHQPGLGQRIDRDDPSRRSRLAFSSADSIRGWLVPGFCPTMTIRSASCDVVAASPSPCRCRCVSSQRGARRLVAHVRAVRQVVRAEAADEQLVEERGLVAGAARGVEHRLVGDGQRVQLARRSARRRRPRRSARSGWRRGASTIGSVSRPCWPSQYSVCSRQLGDRVRGEERRGRRACVVASSATALAPFSQNSAGVPAVRVSGQAQPGQSKPAAGSAAPVPPRCGPDPSGRGRVAATPSPP